MDIDSKLGFIERLILIANEQPQKIAFKFLHENKIEEITYDELDHKARSIAVHLQFLQAQNERVMLFFSPGIDYILAFIGCLYAGVIPVPAYPPRNNHHLQRLQNIIDDAKAAYIFTNQQIAEQYPFTNKVITIENIAQSSTRDWQFPNFHPDHLAYLQYTSGSTGSSKGVMISHANLVANLRYIEDIFKAIDIPKVGFWLPPYHDMGLVFGILYPLYKGITSVLTAPVTFVKRPLGWLEMIAKEKIAFSGAPNFAYDLCVAAASPEKIAHLDLSCLKVTINGAEPISAKAMQRFIDTFSRCGFSKHSMYPAYGMAETTLLLTTKNCDDEPTTRILDKKQWEKNRVVNAKDISQNCLEIVGCGYCYQKHRIIIVNPVTKTLCKNTVIGEIWAKGPSIAQGYWQKPQLTAKIFNAHLKSDASISYLRTGDLGYIDKNGELFVTGRIKDLIIIRGRNFYPQDLERSTFLSHSDLLENRAAAFSMMGAEEEKLVIVQEIKPKHIALDEIFNVVLSALWEEYELVPYKVVLIRKNRLPRTSSGKIQRKGCQKALQEGRLPVVAEWPSQFKLTQYDAPRNKIEAECLAIWREVFNNPKIEIHDNFFELGGQSLLATQLITRIEEHFNIKLAVKVFFQKPTIVEISREISLIPATELLPSIVATPRGNKLPLSFAQQRLWFLHRYENQKSSAYNIPVCLQLTGKLNIKALEYAFNKIISRHEILRTNYIEKEGKAYQKIKSVRRVKLQAKYADLQKVEAILTREAHHIFDLANKALFRIQLFKISRQRYILSLNFHHIIIDGWSVGIFTHELSELYRSYLKHCEYNLRPLKIQYADYAIWQNQNFLGKIYSQQFEYWREQLSNAPVLNLPADYPRPPVQTFNGKHIYFEIDQAIHEKLVSFVHQYHSSLFILMLTVFSILLSRYARQDDICIGTPVANRNQQGLEPLIGFFANILVMRIKVENNYDFITLLQSVTETALNAYSNQDIPFERLVDELKVERNTRYSPLFQVALALRENDPADLVFPSVKVKPWKNLHARARFDLTFEFTIQKKAILASIQYNSDLFKSETITRMGEHFKFLLNDILRNPHGTIQELQFITEKEKNKILYSWNKTNHPYPKNKTIHELFAAQVKKTPSKIAVVCASTTLTYQELNTRANQLAHYLRQATQIIPDTLIALSLDRNEYLIIAILAILKAGAAYVPIDLDYPLERKKYILESTKAKILLVNAVHKRDIEKMPLTHSLCVLDIDSKNLQTELKKQSKLTPITSTKHNHLVYVIYTSGSTGKPKGVMIEHQGLCNLISIPVSPFGGGNNKRVLQFASSSFDAAVWEWAGTLTRGGSLYLVASKESLAGEELVDFLKNKRITGVLLPPSVLATLTDAAELPYLKTLIVGGEASDTILLQKWYKKVGRLINAYGPTEVTVCGTMVTYKGHLAATVIGKPISNITCYVLDERLQPVAIGMIGELYLGGIGVARGYLNNAKLTAESFIDNPFQNKNERRFNKNKRLYKTGDLVRWLSNGNLEYIGRRDFQIKIHGHRIELNEIEVAMRAIPGIANASVIVDSNEEKNNSKTLTAYYTLDDNFSESHEKEILAAWRVLYDSEYKQYDDNLAAGEDFTGWNSYITEKIIPIEEMRLWRDGTVRRITEAHLKSILEIGVGSGLLMYPLLEHCRYYDGLDISAIVIKRHQAYLNGNKPNAKVALFHATADQLGELKLKKSYDCVILNSVCQYFPSIQYLELVLQQALSKLNSNGVLYIGDIRDYSLHDTLIAAKLSFQGVIATDLQRKQLAYQETELLISPEYFLQFGEKYKGIAVDILAKEANYCNELNQYRYDVRIIKRKKHLQQLKIQYLSYFNELKIDKYLNFKKNTVLVIEKFLNPLLSNATKSCLSEYAVLASQRGLKFKVLHISSYGASFVTCVFSFAEIYASDIYSKSNFTNKHIFNIPAQNSLHPIEIKTRLLKVLPEYMVPNVYMRLDDFPLTVSGKLDRKAFPRPENDNSKNYIAPRNQIENEVCEIWAELLGLSIDKVGIQDDFFHLGGDSITSIQLVSRLRQRLNLKITVKDIFSYKTIGHIYDHVISTAHTANNVERHLNKLQTHKKITNVFLANSLQQGFIYHALAHGSSDDAYCEQLAWEYRTSLEVTQLRLAWEYAQQRFGSLRLRFAWDEQLVQIIDKKSYLDWRYVDLSRQSIAQQQAKIHEIQVKDRLESYPLDRCPLFRVYLIKQHDDLYTCLFSHHHAILDGWSNPILLNYIHKTYLQLLKQESISVISDTIYEATQKYLQEHKDENRNYWSQYLQNLDEQNELTGLLLNKCRNVRLNEYKHVRTPMKKNLIIRDNLYYLLKKLTKTKGITVNTILHYVWHKVLSIYGDNQQTVIGMTVSGRDLPVNHIESCVGLCINTIPIVVNHQHHPNKNLLQILQEVQQNILEANQRSIVNLASLQQGTQRLFNSIFVYENYPDRLDQLPQTALQIHFINSWSKLDYPLAFMAYELTDKFEITLNYAAEIFAESAMDDLLGLIELLLEQIATAPKQLSKNLLYLNKRQYQQIIYDWNQTEHNYPGKTISQLFSEQVTKNADRIAVVFKNRQLTYSQLNNRANQLAHYLISQYFIKPNTLVALCLDRSEHILIAILGVLKAGAAYVPIDPGYPDDRIKYILQDAKAKVTITNKIYQKRLENNITSTAAVLAIDSVTNHNKITKLSITNPVVLTKNTDLAYVIYTSGTTGNFKGVAVSHEGVVSFCINNNYCEINQDSIIGGISSYVFDGSVMDIFSTLLNGAKLILLQKKDYLSCDDFIVNVNKYQINTAFITTALFNVFAFEINKKNSLKLANLLFGGEMANINAVKKFVKNNSNTKLIHVYGPTETVVYATYYPVKLNELSIILPIGQGVANKKLYVLNSELQPAPIGAIGELYIGGESLAQGYLNNPELTAARFIANPFQSAEERQAGKNARIYKTGDLVRWLADGNIEYIGRNDFQVKIRGYRIELGEIENSLLSYPGVTQSVVLAKEHHKPEEETTNSTKYLVGYYVSAEVLDETLLLRHLQSQLPDYMIPSSLIRLVQLPLTVNGKLDRKALPEVEWMSGEHYVVPRNIVEQELVQIWGELLGIAEEQIGITDSFFRLGGDSITSIQLVSRIRQKLGLKISVNDIFTYKTISQLYDEMLSKITDPKQRIKHEQGLLSGEVELLPIQAWFFANRFKASHHLNQAFLIKTPALKIKQLQESINKLVRHHDAFRLRYREEGEKIIQYYDANAGVEKLKTLDVSNLSEKQLQETLTKWQSQFDLEKGPVYAIGYLYGYADGTSRIWVALHHLIVDAVSWRILTEDIKKFYEQKKFSPIEEKNSSYRQWIVVVKDYAMQHPEEKNYWENVLADYKPNNLTQKNINKTKNTLYVELSESFTQKLFMDSHYAFHTQINDILLVALSFTLTEIFGNKVNHIILEGHGREEIDPELDISRTVGWFTTLFPVRLETHDQLSDSIKYTKEMLRQIPNKGIGYGAIFGYSNAKLPRISFNYLGHFDAAQNNNKSKLWNINIENSGTTTSSNNQNPFLLSLNAYIINNVLRLRIDTQLSAQITKNLASLFKKQLENLIKYTTTLPRHYLTISDIHGVITPDYLDKLQASKEISAVYLANSLQQGFIYHALNQGNIDDAYRVQLIWEYHTQLNLVCLQKAWQNSQQRFDSLRLRFAWDEQLVQIIDKKCHLDWRYVDLSGESIAQQHAKIHEIQAKDRLEPYQLDCSPLFRIYLIKQRNNLYTCIFSHHHAILDGWSNSILLANVHQIYLDLLNNKLIPRLSDVTYVMSQFYIQQHHSEHEAYWRSYLDQITQRAHLNSLPTNSDQSIHLSEYKHIQQPKEQTLVINDKLLQQLKQLAESHGLTLNTIFHYVWHKVISIYDNSEQTIVGMTISGRNIPIDGIEDSVGLYINTLPIIVDHQDHNKSILQILKNVQENIQEISQYSLVNLAAVQKGERLFDSLFVYENYPNHFTSVLQAKLGIVFKKTIEKLDYPLAVVVYEANHQLQFKINYASELFTTDCISRLLSLAELLLQQIADNSSQTTNQLYYLTKAQHQQIVHDWNKTDHVYPHDKTIQDLFVKQAVKTPNNIAVVYEGKKLTYQQLNERSNQLAHYLKQISVIKPDTLIALCLERSEHMLISILGVLKTGAAYVPIDPGYPDARISYILSDTKAEILITNEIFQQRLAKIVMPAVNVLAIDNQKQQQELTNQAKTNLVTSTRSENLAYVIYTSGTTGQAIM